MANTSPLCLVDGYTPPVNTIPPGATLTVQLLSPSGVFAWSLEVIGTDETGDADTLNANIVYDFASYTATLTIPNTYGQSITFQSTVNNARDINNVYHPEWITTFQINVPTQTTYIVGCLNESGEFGPFGWLAKVNPFFRGGVSIPTGPAGGDLGGTYPTPSVVKIQGVNVSSTSPIAGQVLSYSAVDGQWEPSAASVTAGGDVIGMISNSTVIKLQNNQVKSGSLSSTQDGYVLTWVNSNNDWEAQPPAVVLSVNLFGDVTGTSGTTTISSLYHNPLKPQVLGAGQDQYVMTWNNSDGYWEAQSAASTSSVTMGGDVSGNSATSTVIKLQGRSVSNTAPSTGQVLSWNGSSWAPASVGTSVTMGGDVSGSSGVSTVVRLQGRVVSSAAPSTGQVIEWNGSAWTPTSITVNTIGGTAGGDLTGSYPNPTIVSLTGTGSNITMSANSINNTNGSGFLLKLSGTNALGVTSANTTVYSGNLIVSGVAQIDNTGGIGTTFWNSITSKVFSSSGNVIIYDGATGASAITIASGSAITFGSTISATHGGTLGGTFSGAATLSGGLTISAGGLVVSTGGLVVNAGGFDVYGGIFIHTGTLTTGAITSSGAITANGGVILNGATTLSGTHGAGGNAPMITDLFLSAATVITGHVFSWGTSDAINVSINGANHYIPIG